MERHSRHDSSPHCLWANQYDGYHAVARWIRGGGFLCFVRQNLVLRGLAVEIANAERLGPRVAAVDATDTIALALLAAPMETFNLQIYLHLRGERSVERR
jgi:hypothetical protein